jgi:hypothetical protein
MNEKTPITGVSFKAVYLIAGELLSSRAHFLFRYTLQTYLKKLRKNLESNIEGIKCEYPRMKFVVNELNLHSNPEGVE